MTPVASSRETLSAVPPGGNPHRPWRLPLGEDRTASPRRWLPNAQCPIPNAQLISKNYVRINSHSPRP